MSAIEGDEDTFVTVAIAPGGESASVSGPSSFVASLAPTVPGKRGTHPYNKSPSWPPTSLIWSYKYW